MLTAVNEKTRMVQEIVATAQGELMSSERAADVAFVDASSPVPFTGPCRCLAVVVFADGPEPARLRVMDSGRGVAVMEAVAAAGWWGSIALQRGVYSQGSLVAVISGASAYGYVYYVKE